MRYEPMIATAMALPESDAPARVAKWRQLVDLMAQAGDGLDRPLHDAVIAAIDAMRSDVPRDQRRRAAEALAGRGAGVVLFARDEPSVAAPVLARAVLSEDTWLALVPALPRPSRAVLRNRRDLPLAVVRCLESYGPSDLALPDPGFAADATVAASSQISKLVARIEAFRQAQPRPDLTAPVADTFVFATLADGTIDSVAGVMRAPLIGLVIAEPAPAGGFGVDGQAAGAFRRRAPFRDARLRIPGASTAAGDWRISGSPVFNPRDGRFAGYQGSARRPRAEEEAGPTATLAGTSLAVDPLRQLIHELRTPLNAILGFASMIDGQVLGPAASAYRNRATGIVREGQRLVELVDDLDQVARGQRGDVIGDPVDDLLQLVQTVSEKLDGSQVFVISGSGAVPIAAPGATALERILMRLAGAVKSLAGEGETIAIGVAPVGSWAEITMARPVRLAGLSLAELRNPAPDPDGMSSDARLLGLSFTLRLVETVARTAGGHLTVLADRFVVTLPSEANRDSGVR
ncbi:MAG: sensor histidine kinase [Sphingomonadaceae bacterium]